MDVNYLANHMVPEIFKDFREVYQYYLHHSLLITTVHANGEFGHLKILIESLSVGSLVNMAASNKNVPDIKLKIRVAKKQC